MFYCDICNEWMDCWNDCENCEFWIIDKNIPIFKGADRDYVENLIQQEEF